MSYHIVHILTHASHVHIDRGFLVCDTPEGSHRVPINDVCAVVVAARGVSFSADCLAALMSCGSVILHCDHAYRPVGKTIGLFRIVHSDVFERQLVCQGLFVEELWRRILEAKILNQSAVLDGIGISHALRERLKEGVASESSAAREYWSRYFPLFKKPPRVREHKEATDPVNQLLNYSYAVMGALVHRSMLAHGICPALGVHHKFRFKSDPLLYDLMEPLRPVCDFLLLRFHLQHRSCRIQEWVKFVARSLIDYRLEVNGKAIKLLYAVDRYVNSAANCFQYGDAARLEPIRLTRVKIDACDQE